MTLVGTGLAAQLLLALVAGTLALTVRTERARARVCGTATALLAAAGVVTGALASSGRSGSLTIATVLPSGPVTLTPDRVGGVFMLVISAVGVLVSVYAVGYADTGAAASRTSWTALVVFVLGMQLVPAAGDVVSFLFTWELMAIASAVLVGTDQVSRPQARAAALWYLVMTQLSFLLLLAGFSVLTSVTGSTAFAGTASLRSSSAAAGVAFVLLVVGFGAKAGLVPLHVWLPRAHSEAPSHVSAAMSAAMVGLGVYGMVLVCVRLLPTGPTWWGVALIALGAVSAVYGILQASVTSDVKRLLAYSTTENVGLMVLALGSSVLLRSYGLAAAADVALTACLLLVVSHAAFKATLFLGAGAVLHATGERDLDLLGGLGARMPWTAGAFAVASMGASALPVTCGFAAEWTLLQSLLHGARPQDRLVTVMMPVAVAVVALTAGLALLTFVKAFGIAFLARPRSDRAAAAHEVPLTLRAALVAGASSVVLLGLVPGPLASGLAATVGARGVSTVGLGGLDLSGVHALLDPLALTLMAAIAAACVGAVALSSARRHPRRSSDLAWGGGRARVSPRMQYTATSYAEPLVRVFDDVLQPSRDVQVTHLAESRYLVDRVQYSHSLVDVVELRLYRPVLRLADQVGRAARKLQNGHIHRYLGYSFLALLIVFVAVSL